MANNSHLIFLSTYNQNHIPLNIHTKNGWLGPCSVALRIIQRLACSNAA